MPRALLCLLALLAGCSKGPDADLQYIKQARSVAAEWALVNELAGQGRVTATYAASMQQSLRDQLETASQSLSAPESNYGAEIRTLLAQPDTAKPQSIRAHAARLKQIEDALESA